MRFACALLPALWTCIGRARHDAVERYPYAIDVQREPEVCDVRRAVLVEQDVRGLEIAVQHAVIVRELHRVGDRREQAERARAIASQLGETFRERATVEQIHAEVAEVAVLAHLVHRHDVVMLQVGGRARTIHETLHGAKPRRAGVRHLECDEPLEPRIVGFPDLAHAAISDEAQRGVVRQLGDGTAVRGVFGASVTATRHAGQ